jgi:hypothetical protein
MDCAPFKTRSLRFEWETTIPTRPLIAKYAMNGAQSFRLSAILMTGPPATQMLGAVIGKTLGALDSGSGTILVLVALQ